MSIYLDGQLVLKEPFKKNFIEGCELSFIDSSTVEIGIGSEIVKTFLILI